MSDYIKREDAILRAEYSYADLSFESDNDNFVEELKRIPPADVEPVVRCKDCKCWTEWSNGTGSCSRFALDWIGTDADDFCSMGERKDND